MAVFNGTSGDDVIRPHGGGTVATLVIVAQSTSAEGMWPLINIRVNGAIVLSNVVMTANADAGMTQQISVVVPSGTAIASVGIEYLNDDQTEYVTGDRNLFLKSVTLNGQALPASSATYMRSADGSVVGGQMDMVWGGTLTFSGSAVSTAAAASVGDSNATINAGAGLDHVYYSGLQSGYTINTSGGGFTVNGGGFSDSLSGVERLVFDDVRVALDVNGNGGMAYRLYRAAFDREPDVPGLGFQMKALDDGWGIASISQNFIDSPEFSATYGSVNTEQFVRLLYQNVLDRQPDAGGLAFHMNNLDSGAIARRDVLVQFSESPENQAAVIGSIQNGMIYTI